VDKLMRHLAGTAGGPTLETGLYKGRPHLIVPVVALMEGVIHAVNAPTAEYVPLSELSHAPQGWNGRPVVPGHPSIGTSKVSANEPKILASSKFGTVFNTRISNGRLLMDAWIDPERAKSIGGDAAKVVERLNAGKQIEVSVGAFVTADPKQGEFKGKRYAAQWRGIIPDHLAMLPEATKGACSIEMGCGAPRSAESGGTDEEVSTERDAAAALPMSYNDLRTKLSTALAAVTPGFSFVEQVYIDNTVLYSVSSPMPPQPCDCPSTVDAGRLFKRSFKLSGDEVELLDDAAEVEPVTTYEPVRAACGCPDCRAAAEWDESAHPRAKDGKFESGQMDSGSFIGGANVPNSALRGDLKGSKQVSASRLPRKIGKVDVLDPATGEWGVLKDAFADSGGVEIETSTGHWTADSSESFETRPTQYKYDPTDPHSVSEHSHDLGREAYKSETAKDHHAASKAYGESAAMLRKSGNEDAAKTHDHYAATHHQEAKDREAGLKPWTWDKSGKKVRKAESSLVSCTCGDCAAKATTNVAESGAQTMTAEQRTATIRSLIANKNSGFVLADVPMLEVAPCDRLTAFVAAAARNAALPMKDCEACEGTGQVDGKDCKVCDGSGKVPAFKAAAAAELTEEQFLASAPESIRSLIADKKAQDEATKTALVASLKAAQSEYTEDELSAMDIKSLERLSKVAKVDDAAPVNFIGRGVPRTAADANTYAPPDPYKAGLATLSAATR
jgi:hypothetical protein